MRIFREGGNIKLDNNDFILKIVAELEQKGIKTGYDKLKKELEKDPAKIDVILNTSGTFGRTKGSIKKLAAELHNELSVEISKLQKQGQNINFDLSVGDVEEVIQNVINHTKKLEQNFDSASAKAQKFLAQFNKKSGGVLINSEEFKAVQTAINGLGNTHTIDDLNKSMNTLEVTYNNMVSSLRNSGKSLNPFINAKNEMAVMDETIKGIGLEFEKLSTKPKSVADSIKQLSVQQSKVNSYTIGTQEWADAYGKLQQMIQKVNAEINNLSKAKSANVATHILNTEDLDKQGKIYIQKISNTIEKTKSELESKLRNAGYTDIEIKGVEDANGKIKSLTATVTDATGAFKQLNFERAKIQGSGKAQAGFVQTDDVKVVGNISSAIDKVQNNLSSLKAKWEEQGVLVGDFKTKVEQLESSLSSVGSKGELNGLKSQIQDLKNEASTLSRINEIQLSIGDKGDVTTQLKTLNDNFTKLGLSADEVKSKMSGVDTELTELKSLLNSGANNSAIIAQFDKMQSVLKETQNDLRTTRSEYSLLVSAQQRLNKANTIEAWKQKNSAITKQAQADTQAYIDTLRNLNVQMTKMEFEQISRGFKETEISMRGINKLGASFKEQMSQAAQSFTQWLSVSSAVMLVISKTRNAISELKEINTLLTEISKANDKLSKSDLDNIGNNSFDIASKYGKNATDYLSGVQEASRAGYENAEGIAELSVAAQGAGDMTAELANQYLIATDKAYKFGGSVEKLTEVLDGSNYITNHNAVNMTELAESMSIVGSTAASFGVDVDETTAALGTMIATTQQSGSEVARAFKAILLNIRQVSDEEEGIDAEGLTKYENACNALNVKLKETKNGVLSLRDPMEVLRDLSIEYNKLEESDIRRTELLSSVGGKLRATQLDALLRQWDTYETMLQQYADGTGSMAVEAEKTANSWEGSMNRLGNTWKDTIENIADSDAIITVINSLNSLLSVVNNVTDKLGSLGTIGLGAGIFAGAENTGKCRMSVRIS